MNKKVKKIFQSNEPYIFLIIILLGIVVQIRSGQFFTANNIVDLLSAMIVPGLFAIAEFMALIAGGIDVSFPALASLSAYATTKFLLDKNYEGNVLLAFVIAIAIGAVLGAFNGYFIGYLNLNAMIVTLGSASIFQGIMQGTLRANQLSVIPPGMKSFGTAAFLTATNKANGLTSILPYTFIILVLVCAVMHFVLHYTIFGRGIYAIGGNLQSAHTAGFNVKNKIYHVYYYRYDCICEWYLSCLHDAADASDEYAWNGNEHHRRCRSWRRCSYRWCRYTDRLYSWYFPDHPGTELHDPSWNSDNLE